MNQSLADPRSPSPHRGPVTQLPRGATSLPKAPATSPFSPSPTPPFLTPPPGSRGLKADNNRKRQLAPPSGSAGHFRSPSPREPERCARAGAGFGGGGGNAANGQHGAFRGQRILTWFPLRLDGATGACEHFPRRVVREAGEACRAAGGERAPRGLSWRSESAASEAEARSPSPFSRAAGPPCCCAPWGVPAPPSSKATLSSFFRSSE